MAKIFVTKQLPGNPLAGLTGHDVSVSEKSSTLSSAELIEKISGVDAILSLLTDKIDGEVMDAAGPSLKVISNYAVGFDNIDVAAATERGIVVTNTPCDEVNEAVAEHTWALIFALTRRIVEADEATRNGAYKGWEPDIFLGKTLKGKQLGIVGMGRIGEMVAVRAKGFEMKVSYTKRTADPEAEARTGATFKTLENLLADSDIVSLHVPLTPDTRHMISAKTLSLMKPGSYLINTARGPVVNEHDLVESLRNGHLAGAALDVFDNEPTIHPELVGMENVVLTPHIASATIESRNAMGKQAVDGLMNALSGTKPSNLVNPDVWERRRK